MIIYLPLIIFTHTRQASYFYVCDLSVFDALSGRKPICSTLNSSHMVKTVGTVSQSGLLKRPEQALVLEVCASCSGAIAQILVLHFSSKNPTQIAT